MPKTLLLSVQKKAAQRKARAEREREQQEEMQEEQDEPTFLQELKPH